MNGGNLAHLFDEGKVNPIDYVKNNTDYLSKFNEEDIKDVQADWYNNLYILLKNGDLYYGNKIIKDIDYIHQMNFFQLFAITNDKKIICLNSEEFQNYFGNIQYEKIVTYIFGIIALFKGEVKIAVDFCDGGSCIDFQNFINVEDIDVDDDNEVYVKKNGKWIKFFIN